MAPYYFAKTLDTSFDEAIENVTAALKEQGFGVLTEIDVRETLKKKLDVAFRPYRILGACNPPYAQRALQAEGKIGILLPCNVVVDELAPERIEVAAVDPLEAMAMIDNPELQAIAAEIGEKLKKVLARL